MIFHDTNERRRDFGVWRFFDKLNEEAPTYEFLHARSLGVAVGAETAEPIKRLCRLTEQRSGLGARLAWFAVAAKDTNAIFDGSTLRFSHLGAPGWRNKTSRLSACP